MSLVSLDEKIINQIHMQHPENPQGPLDMVAAVYNNRVLLSKQKDISGSGDAFHCLAACLQCIINIPAGVGK